MNDTVKQVTDELGLAWQDLAGKSKSSNPSVIWKAIQCLERMIQSGQVKTIIREGLSKSPPNEAQELFIEFFEIYLEAVVAAAKQRLYDYSLLKLLSKGDLRKAQLIEDEIEQNFRFLQFRIHRDDPQMKAFCQYIGRTMDPQKIARLGRILKQPPLEFEHIFTMKKLLPSLWALPEVVGGKVILPLCLYSDPALTLLLQKTRFFKNISEDALRKTWERMGLHKARKPLITLSNLK